MLKSAPLSYTRVVNKAFRRPGVFSVFIFSMGMEKVPFASVVPSNKIVVVGSKYLDWSENYNTNNSYDDVIDTLNDKAYLDELIEKYWFITDNIKNDKLYYSLEGYLFPDTYYFSNKDVTVKEIIEKMLDKMGKVLEEYKDEIENSNLSIHEILTLASIIEKEGKTQDFAMISSVFYNRLKLKMALGSCATAYYGMGMDFDEVGIATSEMMSNINDYNTYILTSLPIGPISLPGLNAIIAAIKPDESDNLYFLSYILPYL